jgi:hypothetical protein
MTPTLVVLVLTFYFSSCFVLAFLAPFALSVLIYSVSIAINALQSWRMISHRLIVPQMLLVAVAIVGLNPTHAPRILSPRRRTDDPIESHALDAEIAKFGESRYVCSTPPD